MGLISWLPHHQSVGLFEDLAIRWVNENWSDKWLVHSKWAEKTTPYVIPSIKILNVCMYIYIWAIANTLIYNCIDYISIYIHVYVYIYILHQSLVGYHPHQHQQKHPKSASGQVTSSRPGLSSSSWSYEKWMVLLPGTSQKWMRTGGSPILETAHPKKEMKLGPASSERSPFLAWCVIDLW